MIRQAVNNPVTINLLMLFIIAIGLLEGVGLRQELFPPTTPSLVVIRTPYPGATPAEIEEQISRKIEEAIQDVQGIKEYRSTITEGMSVVVLEIESGENLQRISDEVRREIDALDTLPQAAEETVVIDEDAKFPVITLAVSGATDERQLREVAQSVKDELLALQPQPLEYADGERVNPPSYSDIIRSIPRITDITVTGLKEPEVQIEVDPQALAKHGMSVNEVASAVSSNNRDFPGGVVELDEGSLVVRTVGETKRLNEVLDLVVRANPDGSFLRLADVAKVKGDFKDVEMGSVFYGPQDDVDSLGKAESTAPEDRFFGGRAASLTIFKAEQEDAVAISDRIHEYIKWKNASGDLPEGVQLGASADLAEFVRQRVALISKNAVQGLIIVMIALVLFLNLRVAFWVAVGLPIALLATLTVMNLLGMSLNLISMFGLLIAIGLLVDDGIIIGENIYKRVERGEPPPIAAVRGTKQVLLPVTAALTTTVIAFLPLGFIDGRIGDFLGELPWVVGAALFASAIEAFLILPAHLGEFLPKHVDVNDPPKRKSVLGMIYAPFRGVFSWIGRAKDEILQVRLTKLYVRTLNIATRWRYVTLSIAVATLIAAGGLVASGLVPFVFIQTSDSDRITVSLEMTTGTQGEVTREVITGIEKTLRAEVPEIRTLYTMWGNQLLQDTGQPSGAPEEVGQIIVELWPSEERLRSSDEILTVMRDAVGEIPGANKLIFQAESGGPAGPDVELEISEQNEEKLLQAVAIAREELLKFKGVKDLEDTMKLGKQEIQLAVTPAGSALGFTGGSLANQIRAAFFGIEAQTQQRGRDEVEVYVRLAKAGRTSFSDLERLQVISPSGQSVALTEVADLVPGRGYSTVLRIDGERAAVVKASVDQKVANPEDVTKQFEEAFKQRLKQEVPTASYAFGGRSEQVNESLGSLQLYFIFALFGIYGILAILFKSYIQPLIVMSVIPFGFIGAAVGHYLLGFPITILSLIGIVALAGIVVNDSSVLVNFVNVRLRQGWEIKRAILASGADRLRPILLTTITTAGGLAPLMLEQSFQAQFLIPMAISLVFGIVSATVLTLIVVPCGYLTIADLASAWRWLRKGEYRYVTGAPHEVTPEEAEVPEEDREELI